MNKIFTLLLLLFVAKAGFAQSIDRQLIASNGATLNNGGFQLSYSLGETVVYAKPPSSYQPFFVTAGFQQPHVAKTGQVLQPENRLSAYPNPAINIVRLDIHGGNFQANSVTVFNALGQSVIAPFVFINGSIEIKLDRLAAGTYIVAVTDKATGNTVSTSIIKQNN